MTCCGFHLKYTRAAKLAAKDFGGLCCFKAQQMSVFVNTWQKHRHINPDLTWDLHYNNCTFSLHWGKAILVLGWMGSTGHTCASQAVLESLLSPQGHFTSSGHHHTAQISKTAVPPTRSLWEKTPLVHVNSQSYQFHTAPSWVTTPHT